MRVDAFAPASDTASLAVDGNPTRCALPDKALHGPMFLVIQTRTTAAGVAGLPHHAGLPTQFPIDYVKVTQP